MIVTRFNYKVNLLIQVMVHDLLMVFGTDCVSSTFRWKKIYFCKHPIEVYTLQKIVAHYYYYYFYNAYSTWKKNLVNQKS